MVVPVKSLVPGRNANEWYLLYSFRARMSLLGKPRLPISTLQRRKCRLTPSKAFPVCWSQNRTRPFDFRFALDFSLLHTSVEKGWERSDGKGFGDRSKQRRQYSPSWNSLQAGSTRLPKATPRGLLKQACPGTYWAKCLKNN